MPKQNSYTAIGLMSGTSLDGLDIALCKFSFTDGKWSYEIAQAETVSYDNTWKSQLFHAHELSALGLATLHVEMGKLHGQWVKDFIETNDVHPEFIASHGHTVFHQPQQSLTVQIGSAPHIAAACGIPVISDFRTTDVALGGQGAPLVPIGDLHLFSKYEACLNLGGVANISLKKEASIKAFDICICNMALNYLASQRGLNYDAQGKLAAQGQIINSAFEQLNTLPYFQSEEPKSLGKEFFEAEMLPLLHLEKFSIEDLMSTCLEHIAYQISKTLNGVSNVFVTGGGAYNTELIQRIQQQFTGEVVVPDDVTIQYKEALIFAFLGVLRMRGENNALSSVTGASKNSCGGAIYLP
jgi:anhydro-N-acetylmuramic acid kinase